MLSSRMDGNARSTLSGSAILMPNIVSVWRVPVFAIFILFIAIIVTVVVITVVSEMIKGDVVSESVLQCASDQCRPVSSSWSPASAPPPPSPSLCFRFNSDRVAGTLVFPSASVGGQSHLAAARHIRR